MRNVQEYQQIFDRLADGLRGKASDLKGRLDEVFESDYEKALAVVSDMIEVFTQLKTLSEIGGPFVELLNAIDSIESLKEEIKERAERLGPEYLRYESYGAELRELGIQEFEAMFAQEAGDPSFKFELDLDFGSDFDHMRSIAPGAFEGAATSSSQPKEEPETPGDGGFDISPPESALEPSVEKESETLAFPNAIPETDTPAKEEEADLFSGLTSGAAVEPNSSEPTAGPASAPLSLDLNDEPKPSIVESAEPIPLNETAEAIPVEALPIAIPLADTIDEGEDLEEEVRKELERIKAESGDASKADESKEDESKADEPKVDGSADPFEGIFQVGTTPEGDDKD